MSGSLLADIRRFAEQLEQLAEILPELTSMLPKVLPDTIQVMDRFTLPPRGSRSIEPEVEGPGVFFYMWMYTDNPDVMLAAHLENPTGVQAIELNPRKLYSTGSVAAGDGRMVVYYDAENNVYSVKYTPPKLPPIFIRRLRFTARNLSDQPANVEVEAWALRFRGVRL